MIELSLNVTQINDSKRTLALAPTPIFPCTFECNLSEDDRNIVMHSPLYQNWLSQIIQAGVQVGSVLFQSVDMIGNALQRRPLFIKLKAEVKDPEGRVLPGIVVLRGHAVAVLPILHCDGQDWVLLVSQARLPAGLLDCLEIPAGMCDGAEDFTQIACRELFEETGIVAALEELGPIYPDLHWIDASPGLLDEGIQLFLYQKHISPEEMHVIKNRTCGKAEENEYIQLQLLRPHDALKKVKDSKTLLALSLYLLRQKEVL